MTETTSTALETPITISKTTWLDQYTTSLIKKGETPILIQTIKTTLETPVSINKTSLIYQETTTAQITKGEIPIQTDGEIPFFLKTFLIPFTTVELPSMTIEPTTTAIWLGEMPILIISTKATLMTIVPSTVAIQLNGEIPIQLLGEIPILVKSTKATSMTIEPRTTAIKLDGEVPIQLEGEMSIIFKATSTAELPSITIEQNITTTQLDGAVPFHL